MTDPRETAARIAMHYATMHDNADRDKRRKAARDDRLFLWGVMAGCIVGVVAMMVLG